MSGRSEAQLAADLRSERERAEIPLREQLEELQRQRAAVCEILDDVGPDAVPREVVLGRRIAKAINHPFGDM